MTDADNRRRLWPNGNPLGAYVVRTGDDDRRFTYVDVCAAVLRGWTAVYGVPAEPYRPPILVQQASASPNRYAYDLAERMLDPGSDIATHLPILVDRAIDLGPTTIVELGTRNGNSTAAWLYALVELGNGLLVTVDLDQAPPLPTPPEAVRWRHVRGDDLDDQVTRAVPERIDLLFIDTSHEYERTYAELREYGTRVLAGGLIICHDTNMAQPDGYPADDAHPYPVRLAVQRWAAAQPRHYRYLEHKWSYGLGVLEVGALLNPRKREVGR